MKGRHEQTSRVKPIQIQYFIANLPPWLRYKIRYMLIHALIPAHLKGKAAKKYYDWLGQHEMSPLHRDGVEGVRVIVYGNTLDTRHARSAGTLKHVSCSSILSVPTLFAQLATWSAYPSVLWLPPVLTARLTVAAKAV